MERAVVVKVGLKYAHYSPFGNPCSLVDNLYEATLFRTSNAIRYCKENKLKDFKCFICLLFSLFYAWT